MKSETNKEEMKREARRMAQTLRKVVLAGVGAVGVAQEEAEAMINRMVARGELTEKDARKLMDEIQKEVKKRREGSTHRAEKEVEGFMRRMNIPTRAEIRDLTQQVESLSMRIEELKSEINRTRGGGMV